jgi:fibronectin type 3 domain-containing protein
LNWSDSSSGLTGFNIYRSTQSGGSYSKLTSSPVSAMTYTDSTVSASTSYYYMVTAVNTSGTESADSTPIEATVPAN